MKLNQIIFPHVNDKKQRKETQFMFCYNIFLVDYRKVEDAEFSKYKKSLRQLIVFNLQNNLVGFEEAADNLKTKIKYQIARPATGNSATFNLKYITSNEKQNMDNYLAFSGWKKKIDKFSYITEGCMNDDQIFIGGKKDMIIHYCKLFPYNPVCTTLKKNFERGSVDKRLERIFGDPEKSDQLLDSFISMMQNEEEK
jgi:hypothetical protein